MTAARKTFLGIIVCPLLMGAICPALRAQTAPSVETPRSVDAIRREFAAKDETIAYLRRQLAVKDGEIAALRSQLSAATEAPVAAPVWPRTRPASGPSNIGGGTGTLQAIDLAVLDSTAPCVDTPYEGKTLANAGKLHYLFFDAKQAGDYVTFAFQVSEAGNYSLETSQYCIGGQGRYKVEVDGVALAQEMDFGDNLVRRQGKATLTKGDHTLTYRATGVADDVAGYRVPGIGARLCSIDFLPVQ